jgi:outer membrane protein TolC
MLRGMDSPHAIRGQDPGGYGPLFSPDEDNRVLSDDGVDVPQGDGTEFSPRTPHLSGTQPEPNLYLPLTLLEAIESALADSSVVRTLEGRVNIASITPADVEIAQRRIDAERGEFQPRLRANFDGSKINQPPNAFFGPGIAANTRRDVASANARITQPLGTGGTLSVGIEPPTAYLYFPDGVGTGQFNPIYSTDYVIRVNQPVLRGGGRKVALAPIRIAETQSNQVRWELEEALNSQIRSITEGYWRLYAAHLQVQAVRGVMPLAEESVRIETLRLKADRSILADVSRARVQADGFRRTEVMMVGLVRKRVLQLRQLMGGQPIIEPLLLPSERPMETPPPADISSLVDVARQSRPALNVLRERLNERRLVLGVAQNAVLPSLDLRGDYWINGLSERLDDSFRQAASSDYTDWTLGLGVDVPLGNKTALSQRKMAELALAREQMRLVASEQSVAFEVTELVSDLQAAWQRLEIAKRQTKETEEWLRVSRIRYTQPPAASTSQDWLLLALTDLQAAMRSYVDAITDVSQAIAEYNTLLAELQQAQGISVYEWRQHAVTDPLSGASVSGLQLSSSPGGHVGPAYTNYRSNPTVAPQAMSQPQHPAANAEHSLMNPRTTPAGPPSGHSFSR